MSRVFDKDGRFHEHKITDEAKELLGGEIVPSTKSPGQGRKDDPDRGGIPAFCLMKDNLERVGTNSPWRPGWPVWTGY